MPKKTNKTFKERRSFDQRKRDVEQILRDYPNRVPLIIEMYHGEKLLPPIDRNKFLIPDYLSVREFIAIIRRRLQLHPNQALFFLVNQRSIACASLTLGELYAAEKDEDGFLYMIYASQDYFGASV